MKKVISIIIAILTLALLIMPASASNIVDGSDYTIFRAFSVFEGVYAMCDSDFNVIEYVATADYLDYLAIIYPLYKDSDSYKNGSDFEGYIWENYKIDTSVTIVYSIAAYYQQSQLMAETKAEFENYKSTDSTITEEEFSTYLQSSNPYLSYFYNQNLSSFVSEMIASSSSSSSGGSSGGDSTVPEENQGEHYGSSHDNTNHIVTDSDCCYNPGYNDGLLDGEDNYKNSEDYQNVINEENQKAIEEYFNSEEYTSAMESLKTEIENTAVQQYKEGDEYKASIDSTYIVGSENGVASAYEKAADEMYNLGKAEGFNEFRNSQECVDVMDSCYGQGWKDGENHANENAINPGGVIVTVILILAGSALLLVLSRIKRKKKK